MNNIYIKGGRSHFNGVSIHSNVGFSKVIYNKKNEQFLIRSGKYIISETKLSKVINFISKIPFIRSFVLFYNLIKNNKKTVFKIVAIYTLVLILLFQMDNKMLNKVDNLLQNENLSYLLIVMFLSLIIKVTNVSNYHGAEHMVINYYNEYNNLEFVNLKNVSRVSNSCGSVLITIIFIVFYLLNFISPYSDINLLFSYMIGYEIFISKNKFFRPLFLLSGIFQKYILTEKPTEVQLRLAVIALKNSVGNKSSN
jgi:uncharacterized protein YqhQ